MTPLRVCVIASTYPRSESDYAVPWLRESVRQLTLRGHQVTVLAPSYKGMKHHEIDGVTVRRFRYAPAGMETLTHEEGAPNKISKISRQLLGLPYVTCGVWAAAHLCESQKFDVVHTHWPFPHEPIGSMVARRCGAPLILNCHGAEFALARKKWWVRSWLHHSLNRGDVLIANSSDTAKRIRKLCGRRAVVLPYGSSVPDLALAPSANPIPRVLFTGRLIERKGVEFLIRAIPHILAHRQVKVIITGDGDQRNRLESLVLDLGLSEVVQFLGFVSRDQLAAEYAACDVWVNPAIVDSRGDTEGLGVGAIEAYTYGKPVVASNVGGIPDAVIHGETGLLVEEKNEVALSEGILKVINNPAWASQLGLQGREFARRKFSWDRITDQLETLYHDAIEQIREHPVRIGTVSGARA